MNFHFANLKSLSCAFLDANPDSEKCNLEAQTLDSHGKENDVFMVAKMRP